MKAHHRERRSRQAPRVDGADRRVGRKKPAGRSSVPPITPPAMLATA